MGKPQQNQKPKQEEKPAVEPAGQSVEKENQENILDSFINSDNTDIDKEKKEAEINDDLDWGEEKPATESIPDELKDVPRKYWKHQTV